MFLPCHIVLYWSHYRPIAQRFFLILSSQSFAWLRKDQNHEMIAPAIHLFYRWLKLSLACSAEYDVQCNINVNGGCNVCLHVDITFADITSSTAPRHWTNLCILSSPPLNSLSPLRPLYPRNWSPTRNWDQRSKVSNLLARYPGLWSVLGTKPRHFGMDNYVQPPTIKLASLFWRLLGTLKIDLLTKVW